MTRGWCIFEEVLEIPMMKSQLCEDLGKTVTGKAQWEQKPKGRTHLAMQTKQMCRWPENGEQAGE